MTTKLLHTKKLKPCATSFFAILFIGYSGPSGGLRVNWDDYFTCLKSKFSKKVSDLMIDDILNLAQNQNCKANVMYSKISPQSNNIPAFYDFILNLII